MSRTQKEKLETYPNIPLQLELESSTEECTIAAADNVDVSLEQRKKDADKPLYLKRI